MATLVVAMATNRAIGLNNQMPWHLPEDLQHFKKTTLGHTLIMGRKTFESIGKALPGRRTIVLTRDKAWQHEGCEIAQDIASAMSLAAATPERHPFIVGGANVYSQAIDLGIVDQIVMTEIQLEPQADTYFPSLDAGVWKETARDSFESKSGTHFSVVQLSRKPPSK
jgi:dihydrofolate reductase